jgi:membrane protease YdiL (CAAX protease family)
MQTRLSLKPVNLLFLGVLCLMLANSFMTWLPQYVRLILNEAFFVFLPAWLYLRWERRRGGPPLRERVGLRRPGWRIGLLALAVGLGLYPLSAVSAGVLQSLLGYSASFVPPDAIPATPLMAALALIAYAVMAPLCEEFLFRGVIQPVYAARGPMWAVLFVGLLFIVFHLSLLQGLSIILLALALGLVYQRTRSLPASMLTHFGANFLAALVITENVFRTGVSNWLFNTPVILGGLGLSALALGLIIRLTRAPAAPAATVEPPAAAPALAQFWPLLAALLIWLPVIGAEFFLSRSPDLLERLNPAAPPLALDAAPWQAPQRWEYEIRNVADEVVGTGECVLEPGETLSELTCFSQVGAYEVQQGSSFYSSAGGQRTDTLRWQTADGRMLSGSTVLELTDGSYGSEMRWETGQDGIEIWRQVQGEDAVSDFLPFDHAPLADSAGLILAPDNTWAWQLAGLKLEQSNSGDVVRFNPYTWRSETGDQGPAAERRRVSVSGQEQVETPAGEFTAWKVTSGSAEAAWYDMNDRTVVRFFNGIETWSLKVRR